MNRKILNVCVALGVTLTMCGCSIPIQNLADAIKEHDAEEGVRYQDDYYDYVTSDLLDQIDLAATDAQWTWFGELEAVTSDDMEELIKDIVESDTSYQKGTTEQKIKDLYDCIMYLNEQDGIDLEPVEKYLNNIEEASTIDEYVDAIVEFSSTEGFSSIIGGYHVSQDAANSGTYAVYLMGPDTLVGKEYLENENTKDYCNIFFEYMVDCFEIYGMTTQEAEAAEVKIEDMLRKICSATLSTQQYYDPSITYNALTQDELQEIYTNVNIEKMLSDLSLSDVDTYILQDLSQAQMVNSLLTEDNLDTLKLYSTFVCLNDVGRYASAKLRSLQDQCNNDMHGITESLSIEDQAIDDIQDMLAWDFGKIYVENYFSEDSKEAVEAMIQDIISEYEIIINRQEWMSDATKQKAIRKLETMVVKIGYPDEWPAICDKQQIVPVSEGGSYLANLMDYTRINLQENLEKIGQDVDRTQWDMTPQTVNAYYDPANNEIVFPAAILQPPFYNIDEEYTVNLGGIGFVIAHEISHAFDSNGALYDEYGNYNPWWTEEESAQYEALSQSIIEYYNQYEFLGSHIDGDLTLSENIADLGALTCITSILGDDADKMSEMFSQLAYVWACDETTEFGLYLLANDTHAPNKVRVNAILSSCDAFYETYDIEPWDGMYVVPENRVGIWK